ncbi:MAG: hypothetical protein DDT21_02615 [Syntrophomonadaceae bacterium]|nr:hypothetical protein [Bacillota bacterium]
MFAANAFAAISAVGTIASAVGVVTGNKRLARIGGIAALAGGVGAFAKSQGWIGSAQNLSAGSAGSAIPSPAAVVPPAPVIDPAAVVPPTPAINTAAVVPQTSAINPAVPGVPPTPGGLISRGAAVSTPVGAAATNITPKTGFFDRVRTVGEWMDRNKTISEMALRGIGAALDTSKDAESDLFKFRLGHARRQEAHANYVPSLAGFSIDPNVDIYGGAPPAWQVPRVEPKRVGPQGLLTATRGRA